jgi:predicted acyltransferase (DUF342 family)
VERHVSICRSMGVEGQVQLLIKDREIKWSDLQTGDEVEIRRVTDASVWIHVRKEVQEFKYRHSDSRSTGKMIQNR